MTLTPKMKQQLKAKAHSLKPVILIGHHGLTEAVQNEIDRALHDHELIKIRIMSHDRDLRRQLYEKICQTSRAEMVQTIGSIGVVYRKNKEN